MRLTFMLACIVVFSAGSFAQTAPQLDAGAQEVTAKSKAVLQAIKEKDPAMLNGLLANDFRSIDLAGGFSSRQEMMGSAKEGFLKDFLIYDSQTFRVDKDSILVSYNTAVTLSDEAAKELAQDNLTWPRYSKVSDLWVSEDGDWKLKFEQVTPVRVMY
jgi:hypothetical protein